MILSTSKDANPNYLAWVVQVSDLKQHPNADRLKIATVHHCNVITGLDAKIGDIYVYFPIESVINTKFLAWSNSYENNDLNEDPKVKGFFHKSSRVRAVKLRGEYSNGYIVPISVLQEFVKKVYGKDLELPPINTSFDSICDELFVWKYVVPLKQAQENKPKSKGKIKKFNRVIPGQFEFHPDTKNLRHEIEELKPEDYIAISDKMHGSNFLVANTLVYKKLNWFQKLLNKFGANIPDREYGLVYSSRTVVKNKSLNPESGDGWYGEDIWGIVAERVFPKLDKGVRVSGEIIGWTPSGKMIQPGYDYGVPQNQLDFVVFKVDITNADGETFTLSHPQMVEYCSRKDFRIPDCFYYGLAKDLFPELDTEHHWHDNFLRKLEQTYLGKKEERNLDKNKPAEGVVLSIQKPLGWKALKLKDLEFLGIETKQLDKGEVGVDDSPEEKL